MILSKLVILPSHLAKNKFKVVNLLEYKMSSSKLEAVRIVYKKFLYLMNADRVLFVDISSEMVVRDVPKKIDEFFSIHSIFFNEKKPGSCQVMLFSTQDKVPVIKDYECQITDLDSIKVK